MRLRWPASWRQPVKKAGTCAQRWAVSGCCVPRAWHSEDLRVQVRTWQREVWKQAGLGLTQTFPEGHGELGWRHQWRMPRAEACAGGHRATCPPYPAQGAGKGLVRKATAGRSQHQKVHCSPGLRANSSPWASWTCCLEKALEERPPSSS